MSAISIAAAKSDLRKSLLLQREKSHSSNSKLKLDFSTQLLALVNQQGGFDRVTAIASYIPFGTEPDVSDFNQIALRAGVKLMMPVSNPDHSLSWIDWDGATTAPGIFNFAEPVGELGDLSEAQLILIPALAADRSGNRLGKGKGFYDRELGSRSALKAAVVFSSELLSELPHEPHDQKVDVVVTPAQLLLV